MYEKSSFSSDELLKNICVSLSLSNWMNYTFILGWTKYNSDNWMKGKLILDNEGLKRLIAVIYKEIFSLNPRSILSIFIKGLFGQMEFFLQAVLHVLKQTLGLYSPIILLAVIYFFYYRKK
jgi:hypothetical protein